MINILNNSLEKKGEDLSNRISQIEQDREIKGLKRFLNISDLDETLLSIITG